LKGEGLITGLEYGKKQLLLTVVIIFTRHLSNWCRPILTYKLIPSAANWTVTITCCNAFFFVVVGAYSHLFCGLLCIRPVSQVV